MASAAAHEILPVVIDPLSDGIRVRAAAGRPVYTKDPPARFETGRKSSVFFSLPVRTP